MPSMTCTCGERLSTGSFPNRSAYLAISENDYDDLGDLADKTDLDRLLFASTRIFQCPKCSELIILWKDKTEWEFFSKN